MSRLHKIRLKSDQFISRLPDMIDESILFAESQILDLQREQMKERNVDALDKQLPEYSSTWKAIKGLTYYNLFQTGDFQNKLFLNVQYPDYLINSKDRKTESILNLPKLQGREIFGISPMNRNKAIEATSKAFKRKYESFVFGR